MPATSRGNQRHSGLSSYLSSLSSQKVSLSSYLLRSGSPLRQAATDLVEQHGDHAPTPDDNRFIVPVKVEIHDRLADQGDDEGSEHRAEGGALAAGKGSASNHCRGDNLQLVSGGIRAACRSIVGVSDKGGDPGSKAADQVHANLDFADPDSRVGGSL